MGVNHFGKSLAEEKAASIPKACCGKQRARILGSDFLAQVSTTHVRFRIKTAVEVHYTQKCTISFLRLSNKRGQIKECEVFGSITLLSDEE